MSIFSTSPRIPKPPSANDGLTFYNFSSFAGKPFETRAPKRDQFLTLPKMRDSSGKGETARLEGVSARSVKSAGGSDIESIGLGSRRTLTSRTVASSHNTQRSTGSSSSSTSRLAAPDVDTVSLKESPASLVYCSPRHRAKLAVGHEERRAASSTSSGSRSSSRRFLNLLTAQKASDRASFLPSSTDASSTFDSSASNARASNSTSHSATSGVVSMLRIPTLPTVPGKVDVVNRKGPITSTKGSFSSALRPSMAANSGDDNGPGRYNVRDLDDLKLKKEREDPHVWSAMFHGAKDVDAPRFEPNAGVENATKGCPHCYDAQNLWKKSCFHKNVIGAKKKAASYR